MQGRGKRTAILACGWLLAVGLGPAAAQMTGAPPPGVACVVSAGNRNAPLAADGSYTVFGIPGNLGAIRARATCADGSVGQSDAGFTNPFTPDTIELGPIEFGRMDAVPIAAELSAPSRLLRTGDDSQLMLRAIGLDGSIRDVTRRLDGTVYAVSNALLAAVSDDGLVHIFPQFAPGSSARLVASATTEGSVSATFMYSLGPRGSLLGRVVRADQTTPVVGAEVSILRLQPVEQVGTAVADADGRFALNDVAAGPFMLSALDRASGDRGVGFARLDLEGQVANVDLVMNGQSTVAVQVVDADGQPVAGVEVTLTALGAFRDTRLLATDAAGQALFAAVSAGDFTASARQPTTRLVGTLVDRVEAGQSRSVTLRLQPIGVIAGRVLDVDGISPRAGVQVRIQSRQRGILTQTVVGEDASFQFDTLPLSDGPFILDAFVDGRLRARVPGIVIPTANATVGRDLQLAAVGVVQGAVVNPSGEYFANALVSVQSLVGLRMTFDARTDPAGRFILPAVPVGGFELTATTADGKVGRAQGELTQDDEVVDIDVLIAGNTLTGRVFERDGITPAGAGVAVYLASRVGNPPYSYAGVGGVPSTVTDSDGRFGFEVAAAGIYVVQAEQGLDRGRSEISLANLDPGQPLVARVVFLAKGTVTGSVRDPNGAVQADVPVMVRSEGAFTTTLQTRTDAAGHFVVPGAFIGDVTVTAIHPLTGLSGLARGRMDVEGQTLPLDVVLHPTAAVAGTVRERNDQPVVSPVQITLRVDDSVFAIAEVPDGTDFQFDHVPLGKIEIAAEKLSNGDRGIASTRLTLVNQTGTVAVRLVGQADVSVTLHDESGAVVTDAQVGYQGHGAIPESRQARSDAEGRVVFGNAFAGDFNITASKIEGAGSLSGAASGTLLAGQPLSLSVTMATRPIGAVSGVVLSANGIDPAGAGLVVRMLPDPMNTLVTSTDGQGRYHFDTVPAGTYTIDVLRWFVPGACPDRDRVRGRAGNVNVAVAGEQVQRDVQLIGQGMVFGRTLAADGTAVAGVTLTLTNPDPATGLNVTCAGVTTYAATSDASGNYRFGDIPSGNFTLAATTAAQTLQAEGQGRVNFDGDEVEVDLTMIDSAVVMPRTFYDANGFKFDVAGNGAIVAGSNNVFLGAAPDSNAERLSIISAGVAVPFVNGNGTIGSLQAMGQQIVVDDDVAAGLTVTRRVYVPRAGYFVRYLEVLSNPGADPITVGVRLLSHHSAAAANPRVVDSSDGDQILSVNGQEGQDRWLVVDDQVDGDPFDASGSIPATGHMFDGPDGRVRATSATYTLIGQNGKFGAQWDGITVPAGGSVILMHFTWNQLDRFAAREAALRLAQLPPEAIDDLTSDERSQVLNFAVPEQSPLPALPNLDAGEIVGRVWSGDGVTAVGGARVRLKSKHVLFGRQRFATTGADGRFAYRSTLDGSADNFVVPVFGFDLDAEYARSGARTATTPGDFGPDSTHVEQDLVFVGRGDIKGSVLRQNGAVVADAFVILCKFNNRAVCTDSEPRPVNHDTSNTGGQYLMLASPPREYFLFASKPHPQDGRPIYGAGAGAITAGDVTVANILMEETGSIAGTIRSADGLPVVAAEVTLAIDGGVNGGGTRYTHSDTAGAYRFVDVPIGASSIQAIDPISRAEGGADGIVVAVDLETRQDVVLAGFGTLNVHVRFARGAPAGSGLVQHQSGGAMADANGLATFELPVGEHPIRAFLPEAPNSSEVYAGAALGIVSSNGQTSDITVVLPPAGTVSGTMVRPDGSTLAGGFPYYLRSISGAGIGIRHDFTAQNGVYRQPALPLGHYLITAFDDQQDRFADAEFEISEDGQERVLDLTLLPDRIALPANLLDANRFVFDVQQGGGLDSGSGAFANGAAQLLVDGQAYAGESSARLDAERRQFIIAQPATLSGLKVTRKIFVPRGAYFARYLEVLDNPGATPISATIELASRFAAGTVVATSSGDASVDAADTWVTLDDAIDQDIKVEDEQMPAIAEVFASPDAGSPASAIEIDTSTAQPVLRKRWNQLTVPAGGRVVLMHFVVQQINRRGALAAAQRLAQLPPEVLAFMTADDLTAVGNFVVPADGVSLLEPLPALTAAVSGIAFEGDLRTPVRGAYITVQSEHPLFNRTWGLRPDPYPWCTMPGTMVAGLLSTATLPANVQNPPPLGSFAIAGQLTAVDSIVIPEGVPLALTAQVAAPCFDRYSGHSTTRLPSRIGAVVPPVQADVVWDSGVLTGTINGTLDYSVSAGRVYRSIDMPDPEPLQFVPIAADGSYVYPGLPPGQLDLLFDATGPQSEFSGDLRGQRLAAQVSLGQITVTDIDLQPTGKLQGAVLTANGEAAVNAPVRLEGAAEQQSYDQCASGCVPAALDMHKGKRPVRRSTLTDSLGRYSFAAVPAGTYQLRVIDPISDAVKTASLAITANQVSVQNVILSQPGSVELAVVDAADQAVNEALVFLHTEALGADKLVGRTDAMGHLTIANIAEGPYTIRVKDPRFPNIAYFDRSLAGTVPPEGQNLNSSARLLAAATLAVAVVDNQAGGSALADVQVVISDARGPRFVGVTDILGRIQIDGVPEGGYRVTASLFRPSGPVEKSATGVIGLGDDNQTRAIAIGLGADVVSLPQVVYGANRDFYYLGVDGSGPAANPPLSVGGVRFRGANSGNLQLDGREVLVAEPELISGLRVSRRQYVPSDGYFARYLEVLENPGTSDILTAVVVKQDGQECCAVLATSSGDALLSNTGPDRDVWFAAGGSGRASAYVAGGAGAPAPAQIDALSFGARLTWNNLRVPAGGKVMLLHFRVEAPTLLAARASAARLTQWPAEAQAGLASAELASVLNFPTPPAGGSPPALPALNARLSGRVLNGDGSPVVGAKVSVRSGFAPFDRLWDSQLVASLVTDADGQYLLQGNPDNTPQSVPLPVGVDLVLAVQHPQSAIELAGTAVFAPGSSSTSADLRFGGGVIRGRVTGAFHAAPVLGVVRASRSGFSSPPIALAADGSFVIGGLAAGSYTLAAELRNPAGQITLRGSQSDVLVVSGQSTTREIPLPANGALIGRVWSASGTPLAGRRIDLGGWYADSDGEGRFAFDAVAVGSYPLRTTNPDSGAEVVANVEVADAALTVHDLVDVGVGTVRLRVNYASGAIAGGVSVFMTASTQSSERQVGVTDAGSGELLIVVPVGEFSLRAMNPRNQESTQLTGVLVADGDSQTLTLTLQPWARARVRVIDADAGDAPVNDALLLRLDAGSGSERSAGFSGQSTPAGEFAEINLHSKSWLSALTADGRESTLRIVLDPADDGQLLTPVVVLKGSLGQLGSIGFAGARQLWAVPVVAGDHLAVGVVPITSYCQYRVQVVPPVGGGTVVSAKRFGPAEYFNSQDNVDGNARDLTAAVSGEYLLAVDSTCAESLGDYRLSASINNLPVAVLAPAASGTLSGHTLRADGQTPFAGALIELREAGAAGAVKRTSSGPDGGFAFADVGVGTSTLAFVPAPTIAPIPLADASITAAGQTVTLDLSLPAVTAFHISVLDAQGAPLRYAEVALYASGDNLPFAQLATSDSGQIDYVHYGSTPVRAVASDPNQPGLTAEKLLVASDGQSVPVVLQLTAATLSGVVRDPDGGAVAGVEVSASKQGVVLASSYSDALGGYSLPNLPIGALELSATDPRNLVRTLRTIDLDHPGTFTEELLLIGHGAVQVRVTRPSGAPVRNAEIRLGYEDQGQAIDFLNATTDDGGSARVDAVPVGRLVVVTARKWSFGDQADSVSASIELASHGDVAAVNMVLATAAPQLEVRIIPVDGLPMPGTCTVTLAVGPESGDQRTAECASVFQLESADVGVGVVSATDYGSFQSDPFNVELLAGSTVALSIPVSIISGTVQHAEGQPVPMPELLGEDGSGSSISGQGGADGGYRVFGAKPGPFTLSATDSGSGLSATRDDVLADPGIAVRLDFTLPGFAAVVGTLRDPLGLAQPDTAVYLDSTGFGNAIERETTTDDQGQYRFDQVALGEVSVGALLPGTGNVAAGLAVLAQQGETATVDLRFGATGTVSGTAWLGAGEPAAHQYVELRSSAEGVAFRRLSLVTETDDAGHYQFADLVPGPMALILGTYAEDEQRGYAAGVVVAGANLALDVGMGNARTLPATLLDGRSGASFEIGGEGGPAIYDPYLFAAAPLLTVAAHPWPAQGVAQYLAEGRELQLPANSVAGARISRRYFVPASGGYARVLESFYNDQSVALDLPIRLRGRHADAAPTLVADLGGSWVMQTGSASTASLATVFRGGQGPLPDVLDFADRQRGFAWGWNLSLAPGQTQRLLYYLVPQAGDPAAAQALAAALAAQSEPGMFDGLSDIERTQIQNFTVP